MAGGKFLAGSAHGLTIDRHYAGWHTGQRTNPRDEALLELLWVEGGKDIAEVIVRRRTIEERPEPPEAFELPAPEACDFDKGFRARENRDEREQKHLAERISDLAALAWVH